MTDMDDLIARLGVAAEGSRELDAEIHVKVNDWRLFKVGPDYDGDNECEVYTPGGGLPGGFVYPPRGRVHPYFHVPDLRYTQSIDTALMLLPAGWGYALSASSLDHPMFAVIAPYKKSDPPMPYQEGHGKTVPLALCVAALKARKVLAET